MGDEADQLITNDWQRRDLDRLRTTRPLKWAGGMALLWLLLFLVGVPFAVPAASPLSAICGGTVVALILVLVYVSRRVEAKGRPFVPTSGVWYFAGMQDGKFEREQVLGLVRGALARRGYRWTERSAEVHAYLWFQMFDLEAGFRVRIRYRGASESPLVDVGVGPETPANAAALASLREEISRAFDGAYGLRAPPGPPAARSPPA